MPRRLPQPMSWDPDAGRVTRAYDEWSLIDRDIRRFLLWTSEVVEREYEERWDALAAAPGDPEGPDLVDVFYSDVGRLLPDDHGWMLRAAAVKDGVTTFEVYLEKAANEVLADHGLAFRLQPGRTPFWSDLIDIYRLIGVKIDTDEVAGVRELRHVLTHLRGELRTEELRQRLGGGETIPSSAAVLTVEDTISNLDVLSRAVMRVDTVAWKLSWGGQRSDALMALDDESSETGSVR